VTFPGRRRLVAVAGARSTSEPLQLPLTGAKGFRYGFWGSVMYSVNKRLQLLGFF